MTQLLSIPNPPAPRFISAIVEPGEVAVERLELAMSEAGIIAARNEAFVCRQGKPVQLSPVHKRKRRKPPGTRKPEPDATPVELDGARQLVCIDGRYGHGHSRYARKAVLIGYDGDKAIVKPFGRHRRVERIPKQFVKPWKSKEYAIR
ncbi:MAG: hypothetical protein KGL39_57970 [Patescibacteria group bacterium]|nr:hypothetical protein [Patescibacteria group bacterium]